MSNTFFQFKQFTIQQKNAPLKVTTDACLFGALIQTENARSILDIGTGTGLLALMLAQKSSATILGIELDEESVLNAENNFSSSIWREKIRVIHSDIKEWSRNTTSKFDLIVCNPPFFTSHKKNMDVRISQARHNHSLTQTDLIEIILKHLSENGRTYIMLPPNEMKLLVVRCIEQKIFPNRKYIVSSTEEKTAHLFIISFSYRPENFPDEKIFIHKKNGKYSIRFMELLNTYYLHL